MADTTHASRRDQLAEERDRLRHQLRPLGRGPDAVLDFDEGFADSGQVTAERGEVDALAGKLVETLEEAEDARAECDAGDYGNCGSSGRASGGGRLDAMPAARLCISCASKPR